MEKRELVTRRPHPHDGRAVGLHLTAKGCKLMRDAERTAAELETEVTSSLSAAESKTLISLLKKVYQARQDGDGAHAASSERQPALTVAGFFAGCYCLHSRNAYTPLPAAGKRRLEETGRS